MCPVRILQVIYCFVWVLISVRFYNAQKEPSCGRAKNCNECMGIRPVCSWCSADEFDDTKEGPGFRCAPSSVLLARGCPKDSIEDVESVVLDVKTLPLQNSSNHYGDNAASYEVKTFFNISSEL
ncbi:Integrin beta isoform 2 [Schistosoma japonicum]|uniref:Integrin beta isoform 2 n=1 Tax=Schistosoma japonicum TaxID=6182 RepID=A0A4Z2CWC9_SCHJA|nr:Integrin beta [Schistosoma japonicum]TNN08559.1 Integrin beta isoform 2 [Schistosoma japonicum]